MHKCGNCPLFEPFLVENEIEMGRCNKYMIDEIPETKTACIYAENHTLVELEKEAFEK